MHKKIWLSSPHMGGAEQTFVKEAFDLNWIAPLGPHVNGFEADLQQYTGVDHAAALSSGTAAIHLALILLGVKSGDEVICQSMTFSASANPIAYQGATPVFIDSEPDTWNLDPELLEQAITDRIKKSKKPKAIIPVHLYGMPAKMQEIQAIAGKHSIPVIEDAAEALGAHSAGARLYRVPFYLQTLLLRDCIALLNPVPLRKSNIPYSFPIWGNGQHRNV